MYRGKEGKGEKTLSKKVIRVQEHNSRDKFLASTRVVNVIKRGNRGAGV